MQVPIGSPIYPTSKGAINKFHFTLIEHLLPFNTSLSEVNQNDL